MLVRSPKINIKYSLILLIIVIWHSASASADIYPFDVIAKGGIYTSSQIDTPTPTTPIPTTAAPTSTPTVTPTPTLTPLVTLTPILDLTPTVTSTVTSTTPIPTTPTPTTPTPTTPTPTTPTPTTPTPTTPISTGNPSIVKTGAATVRSGQLFDLDNGTETSDLGSADFWWGQLPNGERYLIPKNTNGDYTALQVQFAIMGLVDFKMVDCSKVNNSLYSSSKINGGHDNQIPTGTVVCAKTHLGNFSKFIIDSNGFDLAISWILTPPVFQMSPEITGVFTYIDIDSIPEGAGILMDGKDEGKMTPDRFYYDYKGEGYHNYELSLDGYQPYQGNFDIVLAKGPQKISTELTQISTPTQVTSIPSVPSPAVAVQATSTPSISVSVPSPEAPISPTSTPVASQTQVAVQVTSAPSISVSVPSPEAPISPTSTPVASQIPVAVQVTPHVTSTPSTPIPATSTLIISTSAAPTSQTPATSGFPVLLLLIAIFFVYFLSLKNRL